MEFIAGFVTGVLVTVSAVYAWLYLPRSGMEHRPTTTPISTEGEQA